MANKRYSEQLKDPRWQKRRLEVFERDGFSCKCCGNKEMTLNVHHRKYTAQDPWNEPIKHLVTLCDDCHKAVHNKASIKNTREQISKALLHDDGVLFLSHCILNEIKRHGS